VARLQGVYPSAKSAADAEITAANVEAIAAMSAIRPDVKVVESMTTVGNYTLSPVLERRVGPFWLSG
jgi:1,6-anhydro-N-acetylmuramate kinase